MTRSLLRRATVFVFCVTAVLISVAKADPKKHRHSDKMLINESEERYVYVTGSHMPQKVKLRSIGTDTPYNVRIYAQREMLSTGRQTPGEALAVLDPSITITGRH
ncbi:MAG: hypothetical protein ACJ8HQ_07035 [Chthoniobacterales bacterium]